MLRPIAVRFFRHISPSLVCITKLVHSLPGIRSFVRSCLPCTNNQTSNLPRKHCCHSFTQKSARQKSTERKTKSRSSIFLLVSCRSSVTLVFSPFVSSHPRKSRKTNKTIRNNTFAAHFPLNELLSTLIFSWKITSGGWFYDAHARTHARTQEREEKIKPGEVLYKMQEKKKGI